MKSKREQILELCEIDMSTMGDQAVRLTYEKETEGLSFYEKGVHSYGFGNGARHENARLLPIITALIERVEQLEGSLDRIRKGLRYAIDNAQLGGPANFILSSKEIDIDIILATSPLDELLKGENP